jgi:hypothetical protein
MKAIDAPIEIGDAVCRKGLGHEGVVISMTPGRRKAVVLWCMTDREQKVMVAELEQF